MTKAEFIVLYSFLEKRLCSLMPEFKIGDSTNLLLNNLHKENKISDVVRDEMRKLLEFRNRLVGKEPTETLITQEMSDKIYALKKLLYV